MCVKLISAIVSSASYISKYLFAGVKLLESQFNFWLDSRAWIGIWS